MTTPAERILDALGDTFRAEAGPALVPLVEAYAAPLEDTDSRVAPTARGWARAFDLDTTPDPAWLGAVIGSRPPATLTVEEARTYVRDRPYWRRGTPAAMRAAVAAHLVGLKRVLLVERDGTPWRLTVRVFSAELAAGVTLADLEAAVASQKPVGIVATVQLVTGASFDHMAAEHGPTFDAYAAAFPTFDAATNHLPEGGTIP